MCAVLSLVAIALSDIAPWAFRWHAAAMLTGECMTGFFAVWTVHHGCEAHEPGRTQHGRWLNLISYSMFLHAEHHLFPAVPTPHLKQLARRIEVAIPAQNRRQVLRLTPAQHTST